MTATRAVRVFDKIALRLFNSLVLAGLGGVAFATILQSIQA